MKSISLLLMIIGLLQAKLFATNSDPIVSSKLQSAIVYRNSAELIHLARAGLHQGNNELIIGDISNNVDVNSIKIGCSGIVTIMSIAFSKEWLKPEFKSASYKKMEDSINTVKKDISKLTILMVSDHELIDLLKANREIKGDATGLNVAELAKLVDYYKQKSLELQNELNDCKEKVTKLNGILESLQKQLQEEERKNTKTSGRLALQLLSPTEGIFDFTISYLTPTAYWNPYYDFRVDNINQPLAISYKAKLVQSSGIDWKQVKLTLSTAVPSQNNNAPQLKTWFLTYIDPVAQMNHELRKKAIPSMEGRPVSSQLNDVVVSGYGPRTKDKSTADNNEINDPLYIVNGRQMSVAGVWKNRSAGDQENGIIKRCQCHGHVRTCGFEWSCDCYFER